MRLLKTVPRVNKRTQMSMRLFLTAPVLEFNFAMSNPSLCLYAAKPYIYVIVSNPFLFLKTPILYPKYACPIATKSQRLPNTTSHHPARHIPALGTG